MGNDAMTGVTPNGQQQNVLLVEDEWLISEMVEAALTERGFTVHTASNARDALDHLSSGSAVDVLVTDIDLPGGMDGMALAARAREMRPDLPVLYASGAVTAKNPLLAVPNSSFVPKPYSPSMICSVVARLASTRMQSAVS